VRKKEAKYQHSVEFVIVGNRMCEPWCGGVLSAVRSLNVQRINAMGRESKKYLQYARECTRQAEQTESPERRDKLIDLAQVWMQAALREQAATHDADSAA
jgi:hypothetical protein